jgi:hypothetical protein
MVVDSSVSSGIQGTPASATPSMADHPRYLEVFVGRLLELMVYSVEGIRDRLHRTSVH